MAESDISIERVPELENREKTSWFWNSAYKYIHVSFTVWQLFRMYSFTMLEDTGTVFMEMSKNLNLTRTGLALGPAFYNFLWFSVVYLNLGVFCHVGFYVMLLAGKSNQLMRHRRSPLSGFVDACFAWWERKLSIIFVCGLIALCFSFVPFKDAILHTLCQLESLMIMHFCFTIAGHKHLGMLQKARNVHIE